MRTIYLSSKITGLPLDEWYDNFIEKEEFLLDFHDGDDLKIINPAKFDPEVENPQWQDYITEDIQILCDNATTIYLFGKWWSSCGCWVELLSAIRTNKEIIVEDWFLSIPVKALTKWFRKRM